MAVPELNHQKKKNPVDYYYNVIVFLSLFLFFFEGSTALLNVYWNHCFVHVDGTEC